MPISVKDANNVTQTPSTLDDVIGASTDLEATGNGKLIALTKRLRTLLNGGLPAALGGSGGLKVEAVANVPVTDAGGSLTVDGSVAVSNIPSTLGQKTMANSAGIVIASDQSAVSTSWAQALNPQDDRVSVAFLNSDNSTYTPLKADVDLGRIWTVSGQVASSGLAINSTTQTTPGIKGIIGVFSVSSATGATTGVALRLQTLINGNWYSLNVNTGAPNVLTAAGTLTFELYPGANNTNGNFSFVTGMRLPDVWRIAATFGTGETGTWSFVADVKALYY